MFLAHQIAYKKQPPAGPRLREVASKNIELQQVPGSLLGPVHEQRPGSQKDTDSFS
jgi:hypothetical protein